MAKILVITMAKMAKILVIIRQIFGNPFAKILVTMAKILVNLQSIDIDIDIDPEK